MNQFSNFGPNRSRIPNWVLLVQSVLVRGSLSWIQLYLPNIFHQECRWGKIFFEVNGFLVNKMGWNKKWGKIGSFWAKIFKLHYKISTYPKIFSFRFTPKRLRCKNPVLPPLWLTKMVPKKIVQSWRPCLAFWNLRGKPTRGKTVFLHRKLFGVKQKEETLG